MTVMYKKYTPAMPKLETNKSKAIFVALKKQMQTDLIIARFVV